MTETSLITKITPNLNFPFLSANPLPFLLLTSQLYAYNYKVKIKSPIRQALSNLVFLAFGSVWRLEKSNDMRLFLSLIFIISKLQDFLLNPKLL